MTSFAPTRGWTVVEQEAGPDEDVDIALTRDRMVTVIEFYCNNGTPRPVITVDKAGPVRSVPPR